MDGVNGKRPRLLFDTFMQEPITLLIYVNGIRRFRDIIHEVLNNVVRFCFASD